MASQITYDLAVCSTICSIRHLNCSHVSRSRLPNGSFITYDLWLNSRFVASQKICVIWHRCLLNLFILSIVAVFCVITHSINLSYFNQKHAGYTVLHTVPHNIIRVTSHERHAVLNCRQLNLLLQKLVRDNKKSPKVPITGPLWNSSHERLLMPRAFVWYDVYHDIQCAMELRVHFTW